MNGKTKAFIVVVAAAMICMLVYSPLTQANQTDSSLGDESAMVQIEECKPVCFSARPRMRFAFWFLKNAEPTEVEGTVVALAQNKLIMNVGEEQIRVNMPRQWTVGGEVLTLKELFENHLEGEIVTVNALGADIIDNEGLRIYILVGYELSTDSGVNAIACLKINIED
jgi:hypothetical protein